jgi:molybdate transport system substrate-binding protein
MNTFSFVIFATLPFWPVAASAQLNVLISGGFSGAYEQLLPEFERTSGIKVTTGSGASQGAGPQTIAAQLARGVPANVVILSREGLSELIAAKRIAAGTDVDLARVPLGVAVRAGTPKLDVSTVEAFKQVLLKAKTVAIPGSTSGIWLTTDLFPRLGIAEKINVRRRAARTQPGWSPQEARILRSCRSVKLCTRRASTSRAASRRRFSSSRCFQPPSWPARERLKVLND